MRDDDDAPVRKETRGAPRLPGDRAGRGQRSVEDKARMSAALEAKERAYRNRESALVIDTTKVSGPAQKRDQRIAVVAALYQAGFTLDEIARQTGIGRDMVSVDLAEGDRRMDLSKRLAGVAMRLDAEAVPLAVQNIINTLSLEGEDPDVAKRRDEASFKILAGRGLLPGAATGTAASAGAVNLQVVFTGDRPTPATMQVVGMSRSEEATDALREATGQPSRESFTRARIDAATAISPGVGVPRPDAPAVDPPRILEY